ncbi:MAG: VanZ family protein [Defluviitaleaceae bacterium]|nr:VanZ family protein [Defluviitaleaceae bacterium]
MQKPIPSAIFIKKLALVMAFGVYIFLLLYITLLSRPPIYLVNAVELHPFASYIRALNTQPHLARIEIRNVIFNVIMFIPLGILLPMAHTKLQKFRILLPIAISATIIIETAQFITNRGIFSVEDMLHNTLGAVIGLVLLKTICYNNAERKG